MSFSGGGVPLKITFPDIPADPPTLSPEEEVAMVSGGDVPAGEAEALACDC